MTLRADVSQLRRTSTDIYARGSRLALIMGAGLRALQPDVEATGVEEIRAVTPVSKPGYRAVQDHSSGFWVTQKNRPGTLAKGTRPEGAVEGTTLSVDIIQDTVSDTNLDGTGGGFHIAQGLIKGRGAITAPSGGPWSTGKQVLAGPGFGPSRYSRAVAPHNYPVEAAPAIASAVDSMAARYGQDVARAFLEGL